MLGLVVLIATLAAASASLEAQRTCASCRMLVSAARASNVRVTPALCAPLQSVRRDSCEAVVARFGLKLSFLMTKMESDAEVCDHVHACDLETAAEELPAPQLHTEGVVYCTLCKQVVGYAEKLVGGNTSVANIEAALDYVCDELPSTYAKECVDFVNSVAPEIVPLLAKSVSPDMICAAVGICSNNTAVVAPAVVTVPAPMRESPACQVCEYVVAEAEKFNVSGTSVEEAEVLIKTEVCPRLATAYQFVCNLTVDMYGAKLAAILTSGEDPVDACNSLGLSCANSTTNHAANANEPSGIKCVVCRMVVNAGEEELANSNNDAKLASFLNNTVCQTVVPHILRPECDSFIAAEVPSIVAKLLARNNVTQVCTDLHMCAPNMMMDRIKSM